MALMRPHMGPKIFLGLNFVIHFLLYIVVSNWFAEVSKLRHMALMTSLWGPYGPKKIFRSTFCNLRPIFYIIQEFQIGSPTFQNYVIYGPYDVIMRPHMGPKNFLGGLFVIFAPFSILYNGFKLVALSFKITSYGPLNLSRPKNRKIWPKLY